MFNYMRADFYRIFHRVSRYIWIGLCIAVLTAIHLTSAINNELNSLGFSGSIYTYLFIAGIVCGIVELSSVFTDDFQAKTMQIAIGHGIPRRHVVLAKLLETVVLVLLDMLLTVLVMLLGGIIAMGLSFSARPVMQMLVNVLTATLTAALSAALSMIFIFCTQKTGFSGLLFLILYMDPVKLILGNFFADNEWVIRLHLNEYTAGALISTVNTQLGLGASFPAKELILILTYIAAAYVLTCLVFRKRELDF